MEREETAPAEATGRDGETLSAATHLQYKGHTRRCSEQDPQYEIKSDKTDHVAMHKGGALTKL
ncbi:DUF2945 domain-containing protein [Streptomyces sp. NPDC006996]|uniref:DUF2945 domain-containing protein n=1 Tax=Streptomyces sp. NPDC006996 TaxID=3156908 RepID=UPI00340F9DA8